MNPNIKTVTLPAKIMSDLEWIGGWMNERETMLRWIVNQYAAMDPEGSLNVLSLEDNEFLEILDGLRKSADYIGRLSELVNGGAHEPR